MGPPHGVAGVREVRFIGRNRVSTLYPATVQGAFADAAAVFLSAIGSFSNTYRCLVRATLCERFCESEEAEWTVLWFRKEK